MKTAKAKKIEKKDWVWMPHPAHLIVARDCKFHLATKIGRYIVSTVGEYYPDREVRAIFAESRGVKIEGRGDSWDNDYQKKMPNKGFEELHYGGMLYETMIFFSAPMPANGCQACLFKIESGRNLDEIDHKTSKEAYDGHMRMCDIYATKGMQNKDYGTT